jgi:NAD(P)-dependent dehydrogenase (short-subunit alcohol dehydrogenase family)
MAERRTVLSAMMLGLAAAADAPPAGAQVSRPLAGKVALITGAARGIGRATAVELARQGADIALLDIADPEAIPALKGYRLASRADLDEATRLVRAESVRALPLVADLRDREGMRRAAEMVVQELGGLDILVANAGIAIDGKLGEADPPAWSAMLDVNLTGSLHSIQAALPGLRRRSGGRVVIVTSVQGRMGVAESGGYAATKWGLTGLMKSLAAELGPEGIVVNAVAPTAVETPMIHRGDTQGSDGGDPCKAAARVGHALPVDVLQPQEIATAIAFLVGPGARFVSGVTLDVNAGRSAQLNA